MVGLEPRVWIRIPGLGSNRVKYEICNFGYIRKVELYYLGEDIQILEPKLDRQRNMRYIYIGLLKFYIHDLVAGAFIPLIKGYKQKDLYPIHIGSTLNNHYKNLEWKIKVTSDKTSVERERSNRKYTKDQLDFAEDLKEEGFTFAEISLFADIRLNSINHVVSGYNTRRNTL